MTNTIEVTKIDGPHDTYFVAGTLSIADARAALDDYLKETFGRKVRQLKDAREFAAELGQESRTDWVWLPVSGGGEPRLDFVGSDPEFFSGAESFPGVWFR